MRKELGQLNSIYQLLLFSLAGLVAMLVLVTITVVIYIATIGVPAGFDFANLDLNAMFSVNFLKILQIVQAIGLFIVPYVVYTWAVRDIAYKVKFGPNSLAQIAIMVVIIIGGYPLINALAEFNANISLPDFLSGFEDWARSTEAEAERMIAMFLQMDSVGDLAFNLFLIALLPAISEELFFRGFMQSVLHKALKNVHIAVWFAAFLFSALHFQFLGFIPRMILGAVLGYAAVYSGSLIVPMAGHFVNNALAVVMTYIYGVEAMSSEAQLVGSTSSDWIFTLVSAVLVVAGVFIMRNLHKVYERTEKLLKQELEE